MPRPVWVVLPLQGEVTTLLDAVATLLQTWPDEVDAELLVPTREVDHDEATALAALGDAVLPSSPGATLGELVLQAVTRLDPADEVVVVDPDEPRRRGLPVRAHQLQGSSVLRYAQDHRGLRSLIPPVQVCPPAPEPVTGPETRAGLTSVVVVAQGSLVALKACLEHVTRGGPKQLEVVVVNNGALLEVTTWLAAKRDVQVVRNVRRRPLAEARNLGLALCHGEVVLFLDDSDLLPRSWAESLALHGDQVAIGPVAHGLRGDQHDGAAVYSDLLELQALATARRSAFRTAARATASLAGSPLLVRRDPLLAAGGWSELLAPELVDDDLSQRLRRAGSLVVAPGALAHVESLPTAGAWPLGRAVPLLSAALIVKDEQSALPACLASLRGVVDEVVVCDTGSADATVEIARALGATVITTSWDDDFAAARNTALDATHGTWVLSVDADEQLEVDDVLALRSALARCSDDALRVPIRSRTDVEDTAGYEHQAVRLLRRDAVQWVGAVHEVPVRRGSATWLETPALPGVRLQHDGYLETVRAERGKVERNLRLAEKDLSRTPLGDPRRWKALYELARTLGISAATAERVIALTAECLALEPPDHFRVGALVLRSGALLAHEDLDGAAVAARQAYDLDRGLITPVLALATVLEAQGNAGEALAVLRAWTPDGTDPARERQVSVALDRLEPLGDRDTASWLMTRAGPRPPALQVHADDVQRALGLALPGRVHPAASSA